MICGGHRARSPRPGRRRPPGRRRDRSHPPWCGGRRRGRALRSERLAVDRGDPAGAEAELVARCGLRQDAAGRVADLRVSALRFDDLAEHLERAAVREDLLDLRAALAGSFATPPSTSISAPSTWVSSRVSVGPPPRSTSIDSRISSEFPIVRPIGASMSVSTHVIRLPRARRSPSSARTACARSRSSS